MARREGPGASPPVAASPGSGGRMADCPACHRTFDVDKPRVVALPVDLRLCPTCNHLNDVQRHDPAPVVMTLPAGWAGAIAAGHVVVSEARRRQVARDLDADQVATMPAKAPARARATSVGLRRRERGLNGARHGRDRSVRQGAAPPH